MLGIAELLKTSEACTMSTDDELLKKLFCAGKDFVGLGDAI